MKHNEEEFLFWLIVPEEESIMDRKASGSHNRKPRDRVFNCNHKAEKLTWKWSQAAHVLKVHPQWQPSSSKAPPSKGATTSPTAPPTGESRVETREPVGDALHSNRHSCSLPCLLRLSVEGPSNSPKDEKHANHFTAAHHGHCAFFIC